MPLDDTRKIYFWDWAGDQSNPPTKAQLVEVVSFVPQGYEPWGEQAVDYDTGRVANGSMDRNQVAEKRKANIKLAPCSTATLNPILRFLDFRPGFWATIIDPVTLRGDDACITDVDYEYTGYFYCGGRTADSYSWVLDLWQNAAFDLIEY